MRNDWFMYVTSCCVIFLITLLICSQVNAADTNTTVSSTVTVDKTPPTANSPSMNIVNSDICKTGVSGAVQTQILGVSTGMTIQDENCERLKLSRMLYQQGLKVASVSLLCQDKRVFRAMADAGTWCPFEGKIGEEAKDLWLQNPDLRPDFADLKIEKSTQEFSDANHIAFYKALFLVTTGFLLF